MTNPDIAVPTQNIPVNYPFTNVDKVTSELKVMQLKNPSKKHTAMHI